MLKNKEQNITIRRVNMYDFETIFRFVSLLENESFDKYKFKRIFKKNILNKNNIYLIACVENKSIGFISCHCQYLLHHCALVAEIQELFIINNYRKLGIGKDLINALKTILFEKEINQLEVTSNLKRNIAQLFYKKLGFIRTHNKFVSYLKL